MTVRPQPALLQGSTGLTLMSVAAPSTPPEAAGMAADVQTWRCAAALSLGAPERVARRFGKTGVAEFQGQADVAATAAGRPVGAVPATVARDLAH